MEKKQSIQLNQAFVAVLTLVLVAVLVIVAIVVFVSLTDSFAGTTSVTVTNESGFINSSGYTLNGVSNCSSAGFSIASATNATDGTIIVAANYSLSTAGVVTNATALTWDATDSDVDFIYSYTWGSEACTASEDMISEFDSYTSLIGLVGTIIFLGIVIGVLVTSFVFGGRREV